MASSELRRNQQQAAQERRAARVSPREKAREKEEKARRAEDRAAKQRREFEYWNNMQDWQRRSGPVDDAGLDIALPKKLPLKYRKKLWDSRPWRKQDQHQEAAASSHLPSEPVLVADSPPPKKPTRVARLKKQLAQAKAAVRQAETCARSAGEEAMQVALDAKEVLAEAQQALHKRQREEYKEAILKTRARGLLRRRRQDSSSPEKERPRAPTSSPRAHRKSWRAQSDTSTPESRSAPRRKAA